MKSKINKVVSNKLYLFYNKESTEHEEILFDEDGLTNLSEDIPHFYSDGYNRDANKLKFNKLIELKKSKEKCFSLRYSNNSIYQSCTMYYYKKIIIFMINDNSSSNGDRSKYDYYKKLNKIII